MESEQETSDEENKDSQSQVSISDEVDNIFDTMQQGIEKIPLLEKKLLEKREWTLQGEVRAQQRGKESLVDKELEFDQGAKHSFVITDEINKTFEEILI